MKFLVITVLFSALMASTLSRPQDGPDPVEEVPDSAVPAPGAPGTPGVNGEESRFFFGSHNLHIGNSNGGGGGFPQGGYPNQGGYPQGGYPNQGGYPGGYPYPNGGYPNSGGYPNGGGYPMMPNPGFAWGK